MAEPCQPDRPLVQGPEHTPRDPWGARLLTIDAVDEMRPFLMTIVSNADLWMYVSSAHGLSCGRRNSNRCLFPYETDDRLHRAGGLVGPVTCLRVRMDNRVHEWRPFDAERPSGARRRLYKTELGDRLTFEERHEDLGLTFRYRWALTEAHGFVRTSELTRHVSGGASVHVEVLDGLLGIMPDGVDLTTQQRSSALVNAYRRTERVSGHPRFATYALSARIVDRAEPAEALRANLVWSTGLPEARVHLDEEALAQFRKGEPPESIDEYRGRPGAYLLSGALTLDPGERSAWDIVADVHQSQSDVVSALSEADSADVRATLHQAIEDDSRALLDKLAGADGVQQTGEPINDCHHLANVLFNCMRGGVFIEDYLAPAEDLRAFVRTRNGAVFDRHRDWLDGLSEKVDCSTLVERARMLEDADLTRLVLEYLPITFSRRHGDPSRPWNAFSIRTRQRDGKPRLFYAGNWRDIFQNWEALMISFPAFLPQVVAKFVNASTVDGFNPYRISRDGIDWEVPDPDDPWSNLGYWGDHQIVYLTRLLEQMRKFWPGTLTEWLAEPVFSYADVPYRLRAHDEIVQNPRDTVEFDAEANAAASARVARVGADGRLVTTNEGQVLHVTLAEKLIVPVLAKLGQLVPNGGIWMNTQRPEWNDANNALAGYGLSMVTLYQLRRHLALLSEIFESADAEPVLSVEVSTWLDEVCSALEECNAALNSGLSNESRRAVLDRLGRGFETYRDAVYDHSPTPGPARTMTELGRLCRVALPVLDHAIRANRRSDGLYHAYNLLRVAPNNGTASVETMYEMLEGQVAVLSAGVLTPEEAVSVLDALFGSRMFRADQNSFMLYPNRELPSFLEKNVVSESVLASDPLLQRLLTAGRTDIIERDERGSARFSSDFRNAEDLAESLDRLGTDPEWTAPVDEGRAQALSSFEQTFHHHAFTGRSGTMFGYEGLGSIYWHMVSKLLLAVQENLQWAQRNGASEDTCARLLQHYRLVRAGLGPAKSAQEYGAFPTDPYSHTPAHAGAQQPGMTGQVKEEILTRLGELGVDISNGTIGFGSGTLRATDFRDERGARVLDFSLANIPVRYRLSPTATMPVLEVQIDEARHAQASDLRLDPELSRRVFARDRAVRQIEVTFPESTVPGRQG